MNLRGPRALLIIAVAYLIGIWAMSIPLTGDQKVYLSVALEMRERGEWVIPYLFDRPNFLKPPLQYWATLMGWKVFGLSLFGALVPSVIALVLSARLTNRLFDPASGLPGLLFAACLGSMTYGTTAQMEIWIVLFYLWSWLEWKQERPYRALAVVGVMAWIKGPLYPALWVLSVALERAWTRRRVEWRHAFALVLGVAIGLAWYALAATTQWDAMKEVFFERENLGKMQTSQGTPWGLWAEFFYSLFPWFPALILGAFHPETRARWKESRRFLLAYSLLPALFFTLFPYRVNTYLYLLTPVFAWMSAVAMEASPSRHDRRAHLVLTGYLVAVALGLTALTARLAQGGWIGTELAAPLILNLLLWSFFFYRRSWTGFAWICLMVVNLIRVGAIQIGERDIAALRASRGDSPDSALAYWIQDEDIWHEFGLISAAIGQDIQRVREPELSPFLQKGGTLLLSEEQQIGLGAVTPDLRCQSWPRLKRRMKFPFERLLKGGMRADDPDVLRFFFICKLDNKR